MQLIIVGRACGMKPCFSPSVERMGESPAASCFGRRDEDLVDFSLGEPRDSPPECAVSAYMQALKSREGSRYAPVQGLFHLRERIAEKLKRENGIDAQADEVMITGGASEALAFSIMSFVGRGDEVVISQPSYPIMAPVVRFCGGKPVPFMLRQDEGFNPDISELELLVNRKTKMVMINTPHNPTGTVFSAGFLRALSETVTCMIVADEVYENFTYDVPHRSVASLDRTPGRTITVNSFSKTYCMCGYRVGYLHASRETVRMMASLKLYTSTCTSRPAQEAAFSALGDREFPRHMRERFERSASILSRGLRGVGLSHAPPRGAFYAFPDVRDLGGDKAACSLFLKAGVLCMPGSTFHESCTGNARMSFACGREEVRKGIERLEGVLA